MGNLITRWGQDIDLSKQGKVQCPKCAALGNDKSHNNLHVYGLDSDGDHGGCRCFACEFTYPSVKWKRENGEDEYEEEDLVGSEFNPEVHTKLKALTGVDPRGYRSIPMEVSKKTGVRYAYDEKTGAVNATYYPCTMDGELSGYKVRTHPKDFAHPGPIGETGVECELFGQFLFKSFGNTVVIVGGEHDQLAANSMFKQLQTNEKFDPTAVVSPTIGESGAWKQIQKQYQFFNRFKKIVLCFDSDKAGDEATAKAVKVLPRGKVYIMKMRYKDPNAYLEDGKISEFNNDFWNAKLYTPAGVHASNAMYEAALSYAEMKQLSLPPFLKKAAAMFGGGLVKKEINVLFAKTSVGKSSFIDALTLQWALNEPDEIVGVLSLEATLDKYSTNLISSYLGVKLIRIKDPEERKAYLQDPEIVQRIKYLTEREDGTPRFFVCDDRGAELEVVKEKILEMIIQMGITTLIVDPFSDLMGGLELGAQEDFVAWLKKILKEYGITLLLVCHTRKSKNGASGDPIDENDIIGTSTIMKSAAQTISLERDKLEPNELLRNVTKVVIHKNRHFSETGPAGEVYYDWKTGELHDFEEWLLANPQSNF
jgi:hypothetical protein